MHGGRAGAAPRDRDNARGGGEMELSPVRGCRAAGGTEPGAGVGAGPSGTQRPVSRPGGPGRR